MNTSEELASLLRDALPPTRDARPDRDLWAEVSIHGAPSPRWNWLDLGAAAAAAILLTLFPTCVWLLLYHL